MVSSPAKSLKRRPEKGEKKWRRKIGVKSMARSLTGSNRIPLGKNAVVAERMKKAKEELEKAVVAAKEEKRKYKKKKTVGGDRDGTGEIVLLSTIPAARQLQFFVNSFQSANGFKLSSLELEAFKDRCFVELSRGTSQDGDKLSEDMKVIFGERWREALVHGELSEDIAAGSPTIIVISSSALRSSQILSGLKTLTRECRPAKLFAKHIKVQDQVQMLNGRVNIAGGTPSRIKKLIDLDVLSLSRTEVIMLDLHKDAKGYSLLTLPQVSSQFWDLYKSYFNQRLLEGASRICFYGPISSVEMKQFLPNE